jgi:hypothetical protein
MPEEECYYLCATLQANIPPESLEMMPAHDKKLASAIPWYIEKALR